MAVLCEEKRMNENSQESKEQTMISIDHLNAWYGANKVLEDVNLNIIKNKITAFIGPSGCGKTTLLKSLNRMNDLVRSFKLEGTIKLDGEDIYSAEQNVMNIRKEIGMVFQQPNPFPISICGNMKLPIKENYNRIDKKKINEIIIKKLEDASLLEEVKNRLHHSALKLSGGQQQRLCIARALTIEPKIILFDEPCSALDPISTMKIEDLLMDLKEKYTIVIVTHNLEQAGRIADNVAFFYMGKIIEQGPIPDLFVNPQQKLTQDYIRGIF